MPGKNYDKIDYEIIKIIRQNSRTPNSTIASLLNIDVRTVKKRIDELVNSGALRLTAILDPGEFGYLSIVDINLKVDPVHYENVLEIFKKSNCISYIAKGWDINNLIIQCRFKSNVEMFHYITNELTSYEGVHVNSYFLVPQIVSNIDSWMPPDEDFE